MQENGPGAILAESFPGTMVQVEVRFGARSGHRKFPLRATATWVIWEVANATSLVRSCYEAVGQSFSAEGPQCVELGRSDPQGAGPQCGRSGRPRPGPTVTAVAWSPDMGREIS